MGERSIKVFIATHKLYGMPKDSLYLPVQAGAALHMKLPYQSDAQGESISVKNPNYCELTVLYWAWKNTSADYMGLCHYRRYFKGADGPITGAELRNVLKNVDVVLPKPRNYFIETNYSQYIHAHHEEDLIQTKRILQEKHPECCEHWDRVMQRTVGHRFNMFIMKEERFHQYCQWLFDILFELEKRLDISNYSVNDARVFGFVAERLLDIWLETNGIVYQELPVYETEKVNWLKKGSSFVVRKVRAMIGVRFK